MHQLQMRLRKLHANHKEELLVEESYRKRTRDKTTKERKGRRDKRTKERTKHRTIEADQKEKQTKE